MCRAVPFIPNFVSLSQYNFFDIKQSIMFAMKKIRRNDFSRSLTRSQQDSNWFTLQLDHRLQWDMFGSKLAVRIACLKIGN